MRWAAGVVGGLVAATTAMGQTSLPAADVPPLGLPTTVEYVGLPNGANVSRPLQTVVLPAESTTIPKPLPNTPAEQTLEESAGPLGKSWGVYEYLLWWPKASPGSPGSAFAAGSLDPSPLSGGRFTLGSAVDDLETVGLEATYLFTGTRTASAPGGFAPPGPASDPLTGDASLTNRITGWEVNGVMNLAAGPDLRVNALAGYRYFMANEGLRLDRVGRIPGMDDQPGSMLAAADQFDAHNRFHGGQLGLHADYNRGVVFVETVGKVAFGQATNVVAVSGQSVIVTPGYPVPVVRVSSSGVLGGPSYPMRCVHSGFAVLPEATVKLGCRLRDRSRVYLGYNLQYLSEAVRAAEQIGSELNRPGPRLELSDFWVQGLLFGLEHRY